MTLKSDAKFGEKLTRCFKIDTATGYKRLYDENFRDWNVIPSYLIRIIFCENFKFHPCLEPSIRSLKNVPNFYKEMIKIGQNIFPVPLIYYQRVKTSILSVRMARLNHGIILN